MDSNGRGNNGYAGSDPDDHKETVVEGKSTSFAPHASSVSSRSLNLSQSRVPVSAMYDETLVDQAKRLLKEQKVAYKEETQNFGWYDWLGFFIPCFVWLKQYKIKKWLLWDVLAGLSVGAMVIPQGMSYANLAGLPQVYGLYGAFVPCLVYSLLGSSKQLSVGPVAVTSILLGNGLETLFGVSSPCYTSSGAAVSNTTAPVDGTDYTCYDFERASIQVAFLAGLFYTAVGLLGMGWLTYFLSHAMVSGFTSGAAILIALSQVKYILGISTERADNIQENLEHIFDNLDEFSWQEFSMGMSFILLLLIFRVLSRRVKRLKFLRALGPISVTILSIALMNIFKWYEPEGDAPIANVGKIPEGLPAFTGGWWFPLYNAGRQLLLSIIICVIDMCESMSIAKALAQVNKYRLKATQELRGLGIANIAGAMFNSYTTTGSFSRSAVNNDVGAKTPLSNFITGILVLIVLVLLTPVFTNMSKNVQGAIIIVGVMGLLQYEDFIELWFISKLDWLIWMFTFCFTLFLGVEIGILVGVGVSLILVIYKTAFPRITSLGKLPQTNIYRNIQMYPEAEEPHGMILVRIDAPIFFANIEGIKDYLIDKLARAKKRHEKMNDQVSYVIIDMSPSPDIDVAGLHMFEELIHDLKSEDMSLILANPSKAVLVMLQRGKLIGELGPGGIQVSMGEAVEYARSLLAYRDRTNFVV
jgi:sulfate transporter 4